jgi:hypothetical protein
VWVVVLRVQAGPTQFGTCWGGGEGVRPLVPAGHALLAPAAAAMAAVPLPLCMLPHGLHPLHTAQRAWLALNRVLQVLWVRCAGAGSAIVQAPAAAIGLRAHLHKLHLCMVVPRAVSCYNDKVRGAGGRKLGMKAVQHAPHLTLTQGVTPQPTGAGPSLPTLHIEAAH